MTFNIGDRVVASSVTYPGRAGKVGEIYSLHPNSPYLYGVSYDDVSDIYRCTEEELTLVSIPAVPAGDSSRVLADDDKRENYPLWDGLFAYFPAALCEVSRWSRSGNDKHNPGEELHWSREKSTDHGNKILRHLLDADKEMGDGFIEATALAWRALALCQTLLEKRGWAEGANGKWQR